MPASQLQLTQSSLAWIQYLAKPVEIEAILGAFEDDDMPDFDLPVSDEPLSDRPA